MLPPSERFRAPLSASFSIRPLNCAGLLVQVCFLAIALQLIGCDGHQVLTVSVSSSSSIVLLGNSLQFTATVTGTSNTTVAWSVNGLTGGNPAVGMISASGIYTAPRDFPKSATISITATSLEQPSASGNATLTITSDIIVSVGTNPPNTSSLLTSASLRLNETISSAGHPDLGVTWSVNGIAGGNSAIGTISGSGPSAIYAAPSALPPPTTVTIQTTSVADPTKFASIALTVTPNVQVSVFPMSTNVLLGNSQQFTATITGSTNTAVGWAVNGISGGNSTVGSISPSGLYIAPGDLPNPAIVTITAVSQADSTKIASASVSVTSDVAVTISGLPSSQQPIFLGGTIQLTALIASSGHPDARIDWVLNGTLNPDPSLGILRSTGPTTGTYTAPSLAPPNPNPIAISAYCICDPSAQGGVTLTVASTSYVVLAGAGDIAICGHLTEALATSYVLEAMPQATVFFADGDMGYPNPDFGQFGYGFPEGSDSIFNYCYQPTWGVVKDRTRPVPGNHEYMTTNAPGYFDYWGTTSSPYWGSTGADPTKGYYSYDLGAWHVVVLNSNCGIIGATSDPTHGCIMGSPQQVWLQADLDAHPGVCTLALWHAPYFVPTGAAPTDQPQLEAIWQTLYSAKADVHIVVNGHVHDYERWARQKPDGSPDPVNGIRQFIVGTGGGTLCDPSGCSTPTTNLEVENDDTFGVLSLTLFQDGYSWLFLDTTLNTINPAIDSGTETCHSTRTTSNIVAASVSGKDPRTRTFFTNHFIATAHKKGRGRPSRANN